ncbi:MAG: SprB repeat-containing protein [Bacteroidales bacterium]|nr:SprB repeat-containing protein [Bacteroidales bacterium]MCF8457797.1 SprB repeat-containing protein [Bacteroidales bacterium]
MKRNHLLSIRQFVLLLFGLTLSISAFSQPGWSFGITGENHTILLPDGAAYVNGSPIEVGDYVGVFYDSAGTLGCCGYREWMGATTYVTAWGADAGIDNGLQPGEAFTWKIWKASLNQEFDAIATYMTTMAQQGTYITNGISGLASLMTSVDIIPAVTDVTCFGLADGAIDITVNFGTSPYSFIWSNGATTEDLANLSQGSYSITVTDALAVSHSLSLTVQEPLELVANLLVNESNAFMCGAFAQAYPFGGTAPFSFQWDDPAMQTTALASDLCPGTYHVTVTDINSCQVDTAIVIDPASANVTDSAFTLIDTCLFTNPPDTAYISNIFYTASTIEIEWTFIEGTNSYVLTTTYASITTPGIYYVGLVINCGTKFISETFKITSPKELSFHTI